MALPSGANAGDAFKVIDLSDTYDGDYDEMGQVGVNAAVRGGLTLDLLNSSLGKGYEVAGIIQRAQVTGGELYKGEWVGPYVILKKS